MLNFYFCGLIDVALQPPKQFLLTGSMSRRIYLRRTVRGHCRFNSCVLFNIFLSQFFTNADITHKQLQKPIHESFKTMFAKKYLVVFEQNPVLHFSFLRPFLNLHFDMFVKFFHSVENRFYGTSRVQFFEFPRVESKLSLFWPYLFSHTF